MTEYKVTPEQLKKWRDEFKSEANKHNWYDLRRGYTQDYGEEGTQHAWLLWQAARAIDAQRIAELEDDARVMRDSILGYLKELDTRGGIIREKLYDDTKYRTRIRELEAQVKNLNSRTLEKDSLILKLRSELAIWNAPIDSREFRIEMHTASNGKHWKICERVDARRLELAGTPEKLVADICLGMFLNLAADKRKGE